MFLFLLHQVQLKKKRSRNIVPLVADDEGPSKRVPSTQTAGSVCKDVDFAEIATPAKKP